MTISGAPGIRYSLDGAPFTAAAPPPVTVPVSGTGVHSLDFQGSDGSHGSLAVPIDKSNSNRERQRHLRLRAGGPRGLRRLRLRYRLLHRPRIRSTRAPSGRRRSPSRRRIEPGTRTRRLVTYDVVTGWLYTFTGFFSPVDNVPTVNVASAGNSIPVKFSLAGNWGLNVFAPGFPASQPMTCAERPHRPNRGDVASR